MKIGELQRKMTAWFRGKYYIPVVKYGNYSTEETIVGTWYNGKPIYAKTICGISLGAGPNQTKTMRESVYKFDTYGILNVDRVISLEAIADGTATPAVYPWTFSSDNNTYTTHIQVMDATEFRLRHNYQTAISNLTVTFWYTKTTDTAGEVPKIPFEPLREYTETEKFVGYWKGEPIYGRLFTGTVTSNSTHYFGVDAKEIVTCKGNVIYTNGWQCDIGIVTAPINNSVQQKAVPVIDPNGKLGLSVMDSQSPMSVKYNVYIEYTKPSA